MSTAPQRLTDRKRQSIVDAAIAEFLENGFESTSMDKIAATAAVSKRTVYNHFPSKEELFAEIMARMWQRTAALMAIAYDPAVPLRKQLEDLMAQKLELLNDSSFIDLGRIVIAETIHSPLRAQEFTTRLSAKEGGLPGWVRGAQLDGKLKDGDPGMMAQLMEAPLKSFVFWPQVAMGQPPCEPALQQQVVTAAIDSFLMYWGKP